MPGVDCDPNGPSQEVELFGLTGHWKERIVVVGVREGGDGVLASEGGVEYWSMREGVEYLREEVDY